MKLRLLLTTRRRSRGLAVVETVIALPILLMTMMGIAELGRAYYQYSALSNSVREATRYLAGVAIKGTSGQVDLTQPGISTGAKNLVVFGNSAGAGTPILPGLTVGAVTLSNPAGDDVAVSVTYVYKPIIGASLPTFGIGADIALDLTLRSEVRMRAI